MGLGFTPKITSDMIRTYNGERDLVAWLKKVRLVAKLAKVDALANFLPLYLEAFAFVSGYAGSLSGNVRSRSG